VVTRIQERNARDLEERIFISRFSYPPTQRSWLLSDEVRVKKIISHEGPKKVTSLYQKALLTTIAIHMGSHVHAVVETRDNISSDIRVRKKSTLLHRPSRFFDSINYLYVQKDRHQLRITKEEPS